MGLLQPSESASHAPQLPLAENVRLYILREPGNVMVPLVPADQLPFEIQGVPRLLSHRQMAEAGWKFVKETNAPPTPLSMQSPMQHAASQRPAQASSPTAAILQSPTPLPMSPRFRAPDHQVRDIADQPQRTIVVQGTRSGHDTIPAPPTRPWSSGERAGVRTPGIPPTGDYSRSFTDTIASVYPKDAQRLGYRTLPPSGVDPDPSKKEYCTYYLRTGDCGYIATGCRFKHEMPSVDKLRELGFTRGIPQWYKEKAAIRTRGPTWMEQRMNHGKDGEQDPTAEPATPRVFPDPATFKARREIQDEPAILKTISEVQPNKPSTEDASERPLQDLNLLIDIDEPPIPSSSHSSHSSSATVESGAARSSSSRASSITPSPAIAPNAPVPSQATRDPTRYIRRHSEISMSSDENGEVAQKLVPRRIAALQKASKETRVPAPPSAAVTGPTIGPVVSTPTPTTPARKNGLFKSQHSPASNGPSTTTTAATAATAAKPKPKPKSKNPPTPHTTSSARRSDKPPTTHAKPTAKRSATPDLESQITKLTRQVGNQTKNARGKDARSSGGAAGPGGNGAGAGAGGSAGPNGSGAVAGGAGKRTRTRARVVEDLI
ncbi:hypothetical protein BDV95DRAFT_331494 [Massariosphaeria phaeospora]|uniref:C3H1-type domain-containing protein n=1 Tax=Massariosphaeria phaeospora TaxID=100035 RepID=A0A7C8MIT6_9PLEO|nr:hypothetical protein BDV95DRAFT_331494 [Massariosphaeria phaeospora]